MIPAASATTKTTDTGLPSFLGGPSTLDETFAAALEAAKTAEALVVRPRFTRDQLRSAVAPAVDPALVNLPPNAMARTAPDQDQNQPPLAVPDITAAQEAAVLDAAMRIAGVLVVARQPQPEISRSTPLPGAVPVPASTPAPPPTAVPVVTTAPNAPAAVRAALAADLESKLAAAAMGTRPTTIVTAPVVVLPATPEVALPAQPAVSRPPATPVAAAPLPATATPPAAATLPTTALPTPALPTTALPTTANATQTSTPAATPPATLTAPALPTATSAPPPAASSGPSAGSAPTTAAPSVSTPTAVASTPAKASWVVTARSPEPGVVVGEAVLRDGNGLVAAEVIATTAQAAAAQATTAQATTAQATTAQATAAPATQSRPGIPTATGPLDPAPLPNTAPIIAGAPAPSAAIPVPVAAAPVTTAAPAATSPPAAASPPVTTSAPAASAPVASAPAASAPAASAPVASAPVADAGFVPTGFAPTGNQPAPIATTGTTQHPNPGLSPMTPGTPAAPPANTTLPAPDPGFSWVNGIVTTAAAPRTESPAKPDDGAPAADTGTAGLVPSLGATGLAVPAGVSVGGGGVGHGMSGGTGGSGSQTAGNGRAVTGVAAGGNTFAAVIGGVGGTAVDGSGLLGGQAAWSSVAPQLVSVLSPLRKGPDGVHRMTVRLDPEELGPVSIVAEVRDGSISVHLRADRETGQAALQAALPQLRQDLSSAGFAQCALELNQQSSFAGNESQHFSGRHPEGRSQQRAPERVETGAEPTPAEPMDGLDVRL
nr:hypothetical protein GCM10020063_100900 [Dactylosporangium thailandense]